MPILALNNTSRIRKSFLSNADQKLIFSSIWVKDFFDVFILINYLCELVIDININWS